MSSFECGLHGRSLRLIIEPPQLNLRCWHPWCFGGTKGGTSSACGSSSSSRFTMTREAWKYQIFDDDGLIYFQRSSGDCFDHARAAPWIWHVFGSVCPDWSGERDRVRVHAFRPPAELELAIRGPGLAGARRELSWHLLWDPGQWRRAGTRRRQRKKEGGSEWRRNFDKIRDPHLVGGE